MYKFKYSIIIPHKNSSSLLTRCLASIPRRDDLQLVVVDDNSDPSIVDFDNFPVKENEKTIVVFDKSGKGAGNARNIGFEKASGEKIIFADADDFFNYCFNEVLDEYSEDSSDIVFFDVSSCDTKTYLHTPFRVKDRNEMIEVYKNNPLLGEYYLRYESGYPWSKIIRKDLIEKHHALFQESIIHTDSKFSYMTGHYAESVKVDCRAIYCVTYNPSSITYTLNDKKYLERMHIISEQIVFLKKIRQDLPPCKCYQFTFLRNTLVILYESKKKDLFDECIKIIDSYGIGKEVRKTIRRRLLYIKIGGMVINTARFLGIHLK